MTSGQMEILIGKIAHVYSEASRKMADMMREFMSECEKDAGKPGFEVAETIEQTNKAGRQSRQTDFDPPFDERGRHTGEEEYQHRPIPGVVNEVMASWPNGEPILTAIPQADPITKARLKAKYKFLMRKSLAELATPAGIQAVRQVRDEAGRLGVELEIMPNDPTAGSQAAAAMPMTDSAMHVGHVDPAKLAAMTPKSNAPGKKVKKARSLKASRQSIPPKRKTAKK